MDAEYKRIREKRLAELKAAHLIQVASGAWQAGRP